MPYKINCESCQATRVLGLMHFCFAFGQRQIDGMLLSHAHKLMNHVLLIRAHKLKNNLPLTPTGARPCKGPTYMKLSDFGHTQKCCEIVSFFFRNKSLRHQNNLIGAIITFSQLQVYT